MKLCWQVRIGIVDELFINPEYSPVKITVQVEDTQEILRPVLHPSETKLACYLTVTRGWLDDFPNKNPKLKEAQVLFQMGVKLYDRERNLI